MTLARRLPLVLAILTLGVGGGATAWLTGAEASTLPAVREAPPGLQPNGVNFTIHSVIDPNYGSPDITVGRSFDMTTR